MNSEHAGPTLYTRAPRDVLTVDGGRPRVRYVVAWFPWFTPAERLVLLVLALDKRRNDDEPIHPGHSNIRQWTGLDDVGRVIESVTTACYAEPSGPGDHRPQRRPAALRTARGAARGRRAGYVLALDTVPPSTALFDVDGPAVHVGSVSMLPDLGLTPTERLVLYVLALHADPQGVARIAQSTIGRLCASQPNTIRRALHTLTEPAADGRGPLVDVVTADGPRTPRTYSVAPLAARMFAASMGPTPEPQQETPRVSDPEESGETGGVQ